MSQDKSHPSGTPHQQRRKATLTDDNVIFLSERDREITRLRQQYLQGRLKPDSRRTAEKMADLEAELDDIHS